MLTVINGNVTRRYCNKKTAHAEAWAEKGCENINAVIYARFSSDRQNEASIDAQVRTCTEYAERHSLTVTGIYADEAISGKEAKTAVRAQYQKMLRDAHKGLFSVILIHKYDKE